VTQLLGPAEIRGLAAELDIRPTKKLGQNFVHDPNTVRRIVELAGIGPGDVVLEVGPGLGSLTLGLLETGAKVLAVEIDPVLADRLPQTVAERSPSVSDRLTVMPADALRVTKESLRQYLSGNGLSEEGLSEDGPAEDVPLPNALVANLPYNVAVPVVLRLLAELPSLARGLVMVQMEVAERMAAGPGSRIYGVPSVKLAWYGKARKVAAVPRAVFWPVPNVDSALVSFEREQQNATVDRGALFAVIDAAFSQRRKTLRAALAGWAGSAERAGRLLAAAGIDSRSRGEQLDVEDFIRIAAQDTQDRR
jgi:16S rRNA (adenine1518-N6/adenine1519-N6)-dimethyltransferase